MEKQKISEYFQSLMDFDGAVEAARTSTPPTPDNIKSVETCLARFLEAASKHRDGSLFDDYVRDIAEVSEAAQSVGVDVQPYLHLLDPKGPKQD